MEEKEKIAKKVLDLLLDNVDSIEHLDLVDFTIKDYNGEFGCNFNEYQERVDKLKECYFKIEEEMAYGMAVKNF